MVCLVSIQLRIIKEVDWLPKRKADGLVTIPIIQKVVGLLRLLLKKYMRKQPGKKQNRKTMKTKMLSVYAVWLRSFPDCLGFGAVSCR